MIYFISLFKFCVDLSIINFSTSALLKPQSGYNTFSLAVISWLIISEKRLYKHLVTTEGAVFRVQCC